MAPDEAWGNRDAVGSYPPPCMATMAPEAAGNRLTFGL